MLKPGDLVRIKEPTKQTCLYACRYDDQYQGPSDARSTYLEPTALGIVIAQDVATRANNDGFQIEVFVLAGTRFGWAWEHWFENA